VDNAHSSRHNSDLADRGRGAEIAVGIKGGVANRPREPLRKSLSSAAGTAKRNSLPPASRPPAGDRHALHSSGQPSATTHFEKILLSLQLDHPDGVAQRDGTVEQVRSEARWEQFCTNYGWSCGVPWPSTCSQPAPLLTWHWAEYSPGLATHGVLAVGVAPSNFPICPGNFVVEA
jgi:hypothetical protein